MFGHGICKQIGVERQKILSFKSETIYNFNIVAIESMSILKSKTFPENQTFDRLNLRFLNDVRFKNQFLRFDLWIKNQNKYTGFWDKNKLNVTIAG